MKKVKTLFSLLAAVTAFLVTYFTIKVERAHHAKGSK